MNLDVREAQEKYKNWSKFSGGHEKIKLKAVGEKEGCQMIRRVASSIHFLKKGFLLFIVLGLHL